MNILITGCNGQLGNEMQHLEREHPEHTYFNTDVQELDITDSDAVCRFVDDHQIDGIVNCAAYTAVDKAEDNRQLCDLLNHVAPGYLAEAVGRRGGWMIQISTDYVFDGTAHLPYVETAPVCPNSVYGSTKLAGEEAAQRACPRTMIIRTAWLYSTFGNNFVKTMIRLGKEKSELGVIFDQIGTPTYARDLARAIFAAIVQGVNPGIYHFSNEGVASWYDFTKAIHRQAGITACRVRPLHTAEYPTPAARPPYSVLDKTKIKQTYGIDIPHWEESLAECVSQLM
ncbi:MAG: dTDP-4-dehydrorhamnose reductase [Prevotella sp.]|nr:dTDP-4-dehydrorhamnose reductase [Prevotella sp.]